MLLTVDATLTLKKSPLEVFLKMTLYISPKASVLSQIFFQSDSSWQTLFCMYSVNEANELLVFQTDDVAAQMLFPAVWHY